MHYYEHWLLDTKLLILELKVKFLYQAPWDLPESDPAESWPNSGVVQFKNYSTRYRPGLDLVLKDVSFSVASGEMVRVLSDCMNVLLLTGLCRLTGFPRLLENHEMRRNLDK